MTLLPWLIVGGGVALVIGLLVQAFILQASCALCSLENVSYLKSLVLTIPSALVTGLVVGGFLYVAYNLAVSGWGFGMILLFLILALLLTWVVMAGAYALILRVNYFKGLLIRFYEMFMVVLLNSLLGLLTLVGLAVVQIVVNRPG